GRELARIDDRRIARVRVVQAIAAQRIAVRARVLVARAVAHLARDAELGHARVHLARALEARLAVRRVALLARGVPASEHGRLFAARGGQEERVDRAPRADVDAVAEREESERARVPRREPVELLMVRAGGLHDLPLHDRRRAGARVVGVAQLDPELVAATERPAERLALGGSAFPAQGSTVEGGEHA